MSGRATLVRMDRRRAWARAALAALAALVAIAIVAGCTSPLETATDGPRPGAPTPTPLAPTIDVEQPGQTPSAGQVDADWGPIWATLPAGFPVHPLAEPAEAVEGPVTAAYTIPGTPGGEPRDIVDFYDQQLSAAGYGGLVDGPLEDGSYAAWGSNGYGCDILVTALPRGDETYVTVLYGAGCPFAWGG